MSKSNPSNPEIIIDLTPELEAPPNFIDLILGKKIANYKIIDYIGSGGMADVFKVYNLETTEVKAMKILSQSLIHKPNMIRRFLREAKIQYKLRHRNIIHVESYGRRKNIYYFVMDYIHNPSGFPNVLSKILEISPLNLEVAVEMITQICDALEYAHNLRLPQEKVGIYHRDIKPANILYEEATRRYILSDFGIAKAAYGSSISLSGKVFGSPEYMSPEQCAGKEDLDGRSDIYSVGIVLYESLTGRVPFTGEIPAAAIMEKHLKENITFPPEVNIPKPIKKVLLKALEKDPNKRYQTALSFSLSLKCALEKVPYEIRKKTLTPDEEYRGMFLINSAKFKINNLNYNEGLQDIEEALSILPTNHKSFHEGVKLKKEVIQLLDNNPLIPNLINRTRRAIRKKKFIIANSLLERLLPLINKESIYYNEIIRLRESIEAGRKLLTCNPLTKSFDYPLSLKEIFLTIFMIIIAGALSYGIITLLLEHFKIVLILLN